MPHKQNNHCYLAQLYHKTIKTDIHLAKELGYTFQHYQHGPLRLIEERNELVEGLLLKKNSVEDFCLNK